MREGDPGGRQFELHRVKLESEAQALRTASRAWKARERELEDRIAVLERENRMLSCEISSLTLRVKSPPLPSVLRKDVPRGGGPGWSRFPRMARARKQAGPPATALASSSEGPPVQGDEPRTG